MPRSNRHASFVVAVTQWGLTLVMEPSKPPPWLWKIAGGASEGDETPEQTAVREYCEEVGGEITEEDLVLIKVEQHRTHARYFYRVEELLRNGQILGGHCDVLRKVLASIA